MLKLIEAARLCVEAHLLALDLLPEARNLTEHTFEGLPLGSLGQGNPQAGILCLPLALSLASAGGCHLGDPEHRPVPRGIFTDIWCPRFTSGVLVFVAAAQKMPLHHLVLAAVPQWPIKKPKF